jgi:cytochrome c
MLWRNLILGLAASALPVLAHAAAAPAGDPAKGEATFKTMCGICHVTVDDGKPHPGPLLQGVVGRKAASVPGFNYSPALKASGLTWTQANLDKFLTNAQATVPGTFMVVKLANPVQRQDVLAYLATLKAAPAAKK